MITKFIRVLFLCLAFLGMAACQSRQEEVVSPQGLKIVTSFYPIYSLVKEISGDYNDVRMIGSRYGIHGYEPSAADIRAIYDADAFIYHSKLLESWAGHLDPNLQHSSVKVLEASTRLPLQKVPGLEDVEPGANDADHFYDPHTWLDPILIGQEAVEIARLLAQLDPDRASYYQENAVQLQKQSQKLVDTYQPIFEQANSKTFVTQHTAFSYLAQRFGLRQLGIAGLSEEEPSPRQLAEIKDFVSSYHVKTIFTEKGASDALAKSLATSTRVKLKVLDPLEADPENQLTYLENLEQVLKTLAQELKE